MLDAVNKSEKQRGRPFKSGVSGNARGRPKGSRNKRTLTLLEAAEAGGEMPLDFLLRLMRDPHTSTARRLEAVRPLRRFCILGLIQSITRSRAKKALKHRQSRLRLCGHRNTRT